MNQPSSFYRIVLLVFITTPSLYGFSQYGEIYTKEFSFKTENDAYLFKMNDAYYTNGFYIGQSFVQTKNNSKRIHSFELGQKIFTPLKRASLTPADIDRAYCGYLFLNYGQTRFLKKESLIQFTGSLGIVGPASWGEGLQNTYHGWLNYAPFFGWKYQIENSLGIDLGATYARTIAGNETMKLLPVAQLNIGTTYTNAKLGAMMVLGAFEKNSESALWNARLSETAGTQKRNHELFAYWYPQLIVQGYNATIQGGMFNKGTTAITQELSPLQFQQTIGLCYAQGRFTTRLEWVYQSKETPAQLKAQRYGVIQLGYRFR